MRRSDEVAARDAPPLAEAAGACVLVLGGVIVVEDELDAVVVAAVRAPENRKRPSAKIGDFAPMKETRARRERRERRERKRKAHGEDEVSGRLWAMPLRTSEEILPQLPTPDNKNTTAAKSADDSQNV